MTDKIVEGKLKVSLYAGTVLVAESADPILWQKVLASISKKALSSLASSEGEELTEETDSFEESDIKKKSDTKSEETVASNAVSALAQQLGLTVEQIEASCAPSIDAPYIHLDAQYWEALRKRTPARGSQAVSNIAIAATLLCLWFKKAGLQGQPSIPDCQAVLKTLSPSMADSNPTRSLKNASWLQKREQGISIDPTEMTTAINIAKTYCIKNYDAKAA